MKLIEFWLEVVLHCTVKIVSKFTSFYRFESIVLSLQTSKLIVFSFYRFIVSSFYRFLVRNIEFILSFYRFIVVKKTEFFYRFIVSSFDRFIVVDLSFYRCKPIVLSLRFIVLSL